MVVSVVVVVVVGAVVAVVATTGVVVVVVVVAGVVSAGVVVVVLAGVERADPQARGPGHARPGRGEGAVGGVGGEERLGGGDAGFRTG